MQGKPIPLYSIPASVPFLTALADKLLRDTKDCPETLSEILILLPTRRGCRALQEEFLRLTDGKPLLLPQLQPIGDIDEEELLLSGAHAITQNLTPISPLKRLLMLSELIGSLPNYAKDMDQNLRLSQALGQLLDEIHTENLDIQNLPLLVDKDLFAEHWQITVQFLEILSEHWPKILDENQLIDPAAFRNQMILALSEFYQSHPPKHKVILAGSTGTIPATAQLMKIILSLPNGEVILPGLDDTLSDEIWNEIEEGHPQATLKNLLETISIERENVKNYNDHFHLNEVREKIISHSLYPAAQIKNWSLQNLNKNEILESLKKIERYDCRNEDEEANIIALILRETLEHKNKTAALITPDRNLASRVKEICKKWDIHLDDTAGNPLSSTSVGQYIMLSAEILIHTLEPVKFLSFLKHDLTIIDKKNIEALEKDLYRGRIVPSGLNGLKQLYQNLKNSENSYDHPRERLENFLDELEQKLKNALFIFNQKEKSFLDFLKVHIQIMEDFAGGASNLWRGDEGEAASNFLSQLNDHTNEMRDISAQDYVAIIQNVMQTIIIRPRYGTHPRLQILGQIEARLVKADRFILGGLNECTWPGDPGHDPWMSRPMRSQYGLPLPERSLSLSAHDFSQGFCADEVFITRSEKKDGAVTVPSRYLQRLDSYLKANDIDHNILKMGQFSGILEQYKKPNKILPIERPAPTPPLDARPQKLSVTKIEQWMKDPYSIYAQKILRLEKLKPFKKEPDAADRGTLVHNIFDQFTSAFPKDIPENARDEFITISKESLTKQGFTENDFSLWLPRLYEFADNYIHYETNWRQNYSYESSEKNLSFTFENINFTLTARVDRIDHDQDEQFAIIDYKTGGQYSKTNLISGSLPQLPLEAILLKETEKKDISYLGYWVFDNKSQIILQTKIDKPEDIEESINNTRSGLEILVQAYQNENTPYYAIPNLNNAPRFNDYEHLERVKEWASLDESEAA